MTTQGKDEMSAHRLIARPTAGEKGHQLCGMVRAIRAWSDLGDFADRIGETVSHRCPH